MTLSLSHDSDKTSVADVHTVVSEPSGNVGDERQDCAVFASRPTHIPIPIYDYPVGLLFPSAGPYFREVNEHTREFFAKNGITHK